MLVALHHDDPVGFVNREVQAGELFRAGATKLNHGFTVWRVAGGLEEFEESFFLSFPPLHAPLRVISFEVDLQLTGMYKSSLAAFRRADMWTVVVVDHLVPLPIPPLLEVSSTIRGGTFVRPLTRVDPLMPSGSAR
jgi:hypothetical protein